MTPIGILNPNAARGRVLSRCARHPALPGYAPTDPFPWANTHGQAIGVFIAAALPGAVWGSKAHSNASALGPLFVSAHLPALVIRQGLTQ